jgi:hypothetical protein
MRYLNCPRCHLSIEQRRGRPALQDCPRCVAKLGETTPLFRSPLPSSLLLGGRTGDAGPGPAVIADTGADPR